MCPSPVGPGHTEMRPGTYRGVSSREEREGFSSQAPGESAVAWAIGCSLERESKPFTDPMP